MEACKYYIQKTNKRISFEYALAKDSNDNEEDAKELVKLLKGMLFHVNLIPINKIENGKFTIVLDSILPPMSGSQRVQPYSIEFTFSTDKTINAKANQCIYDTLKDYEGKLCYIVD